MAPKPFIGAALVGAALFACTSAPVAGAATIERVGPRIAHPWGMDFIGTDQLLVTVRGGGLQRINLADGSAADITGLPKVFARRQGGMLDVLVDGPHVYLCYSADLGGKSSTAIDRARLEGDALVERETIFTGNNPARSGHHFGCRLQMAGGYLFAGIGDRGDRDNAQDPAAHAGSILRLNPDGTVPDDNPHAAGKADGWAPELYSIGHRNPQGMAVHPQTGEIWAHEHGPRGGDEINIPQRGGNHGWPVVSHGREYATGRRVSKHGSLPGYVDPVWVWDPSIAPSGMAFYPAGNAGEDNGGNAAGSMFPRYQGHLLVGSLKFRRLYLVMLGADGLPESERVILDGQIGRIRDVAVVPDGPRAGAILLLSDEAQGGLFMLRR